MTVLGNVASLEFAQSPTEIDHYQIQRVADVYVTPAGEDLGQVSSRITKLLAQQKYPGNIRINLRGMVQQMNDSFRSFAIGLSLIGGASVLDPGGAVPLLQGSVPHHAGDSHGIHRRAGDSAADPYHAERDVADGRSDAGRNRGLQQHSDCGIRAPAGRARPVRRRCGDHILPGSPAADSDDLARHHHRHGAHGA